MRLSSVLFAICIELITLKAVAAPSDTLKVLFIGNSYTYVNDMPGILSQMALSTNDVIQTASSTPGGYTLQLHSTNSTTLNAIAAGVWDYTVLQEQSQLPALQDSIVETDVYPYAYLLDSLIRDANPCTETVFYRTWGRKNGDSQNCPTWPPVCTYQGMDSLLHLRYRIMTDSFSAIMSPVGMVFRYIRLYNPSLELYDADESHPSPAGSYAAACSFYTTFLRKNPELITFDNGLNPTDAAFIRQAAKVVVYDNLSAWNIGKYDPMAAFDYSIDELTVSFQNQSLRSFQFLWDFGDGNVSSELNPVHTYALAGNYLVKLVSSVCKVYDSTFATVSLQPNSIYQVQRNLVEVSQNSDYITLKIPKQIKEVQLFDGLGRLLGNWNKPAGDLIISKAFLPKGLIVFAIQLVDDQYKICKVLVRH